MLMKPTTAAELSKAARRIPDDVVPEMTADLAALRRDVEGLLGEKYDGHQIHHQIDQACLSLSQLEQSLAQLRRAMQATPD